MSEENWKLERDLCRCCLSEGSFKNLAEPCLYEGQEEIYSEMLLEHLSVNLTPVSGPLCTSTYTICEECILRLRDACSFKRQVFLSEKRFRDLYARDVIQMQTSSIGVKKEVPDSDHEANEDDVKVEYRLDDDDDFRLDYDDDDNKSDLELDLQSAKKAKTKKPKAKDKPKPKKRAGRPRKKEAETAAGEAEPPKEKKDVSNAETADYTLVEDGNETKYSCNRCGSVYKSLTWMTKHIQGVHTSCPAKGCKESNVEVEAVNDEVVEEDKRLSCVICQKGIKNSKNLAEHLSTHGPFKCLECSEQFQSAKELRLHKRQTHSHVCQVCSKKTSCRSRMISHLRTHGLFKCPDCSEMFPRKLDLNDHKRKTHRNQTFRGIDYTIVEDGAKYNYICHQCGTIRASLSSLKYHMKRHVGAPNRKDKARIPKKFVCDYCGKETSVKWKMVRHIRLWHTPVKCSDCTAACANSFELSTHRRAYHPQTMPTCGICGFKCLEKSLLIIHQRKVHMGEKNVSCPHCEAKFFDRKRLNKHLVKHNPVKKFECRFCKKKFPRKNTRNLHEKIHLGHKNKVCSICDARFVQKASLNYHMKKYHPEAV